MLSPNPDGYGRLIYDHYRGLPSAEVIERDDGWFSSRSLSAAIAFNNVMAVVGFARNGLDLPGTAAVGWLLAALALASSLFSSP